MRILIIKTTSMGDVVHTLPAITDIQRHIPTATIDWLVEQPFAAIPALHPAVSRIIPIQFRKWRKRFWATDVHQLVRIQIDALKQTPYDWIIDFQGLLKSALFARTARRGSDAIVAGYDRHSSREAIASLFYHRTANVARQLQAVSRNRLLAAQLLGYPKPDTPADFGIQAQRNRAQHPWLPNGPYAVLIPAASRPETLWPASDWLALIKTLSAAGLPSILLWGNPTEHSRSEKLAQASTAAIVPPFLTVADAAGVLARAQLIIGLDTGFTHLAAALGRPTIGIYCDHDPGLAGITGPAYTASLGGKATPPSRQVVLATLHTALNTCPAPT